MYSTLVNERKVLRAASSGRRRIFGGLRQILVAWELYPILFIAACLRLYHIDAAVFVDDDAAVFHIARDLFVHGLIPITSNRSSLGTLNPPFVVYLLMIPAAISANPLWAEVFVALFNIAAVLLTYIFVRRYYGRTAAVTASLLYATAVKAIIYSRNIWPQNFLPLFTMLLLFVLFMAVIERRKGWFLPAVALLCLLYQLHGSSVILLVPFALTVIFAFRTIRWWEIPLALAVVLLLFAPYLYWEYLKRWADVRDALANGAKPLVDTQTIAQYKQLLSPYISSLDINDHNLGWPSYPSSIMVSGVLSNFQLTFYLELEFMWLVLHCALAMAAALVLVPFQKAQAVVTVRRNVLMRWWSEFYATPSRQGLLLLLSWQLLMLIYLRHSLRVLPHYYIIYLPGQFILIGILFEQSIAFVRRYRPDYTRAVRTIGYVLVALVTVCQLLGSVGALVDNVQGNFDPQWWPGFNDLASIRNALTLADQVAQARHISHIYVAVDDGIANPVNYLAEKMHTPVTAFNAYTCTLLPDPAGGPVVFLNESSNEVVDALLARYTQATLIARPAHRANPPFNLYIVTTKAVAYPVSHTFTTDLQLLEPQEVLIHGTVHSPLSVSLSPAWLASHWRITRSAAAAGPFSSQNFVVTFWSSTVPSPYITLLAKLTSLRAGDELFIYQNEFDPKSPPVYRTMQFAASSSSLETYKLGPLTLTSYTLVTAPQRILQTDQGQTRITLFSQK